MKDRPDVYLDKDHSIKVQRKCVCCGGITMIYMERSKYDRWVNNGEFAQNLWPESSVGDREVLISGTHSDCFDDLFVEDDDDEIF